MSSSSGVKNIQQMEMWRIENVQKMQCNKLWWLVVGADQSFKPIGSYQTYEDMNKITHQIKKSSDGVSIG